MAGNKGFYLQLENVDKAVTTLRIYKKEKKKRIQQTVKRNGRRIQTRAKKLVPVDEGDTKKSIKYKLFEDGLIATVGPRRPKGWKAHFIEFGTRPRTVKSTGRYVGKMPATPFMRPAYEQIKPKYISELKKDLRG